MEVFVLLLNTEHSGRCFKGVYSSEAKARQAMQEDIEEMECMYSDEDYDILPSTVE
jgi:hypothetical protein